MYELYRVRSVRFRGLPFASGGAGPTAMGTVFGSNITTPSGWNYSYVAALDSAVVFFPGQTVPRTLLVPGRRVHNDRPWFACNNADGYPFLFVIGGPTSTAVTAHIEIDYDVEFTQPVSDGKQMDVRAVHTTGSEQALPFGVEEVEIVQKPVVQAPRAPSRPPSTPQPVHMMDNYPPPKR